jgi:succinyl-CoA synthetase beta subunit
MNFEEHAAKTLVLKPAGIKVPRGMLCGSAAEAANAVRTLGCAVIKAQVPAGKRGKAGGIKQADTPEDAERIAREILGMRIGGYPVERLLVEERAEIARELYAAILPDISARRPVILFSTEGGMDIEEVSAAKPGAIRHHPVDIDRAPDAGDLMPMLQHFELGSAAPEIADVLVRLCAAYRQRDAELIEINPLALLADGRLVALDCKFALDDASLHRQPELEAAGSAGLLTDLERRGREHQLKFIQLDGDVGVLANGAGLTMTTMDVIRHFGGRPANFLEIGGEAYTKSAIALELVLSNPGVKSLVINFCGAFARTDVMVAGVIKAWKRLKPTVPVFFSIHGTGEDEAIGLVRGELGIEPFDVMEDAVRAAVRAAR